MVVLDIFLPFLSARRRPRCAFLRLFIAARTTNVGDETVSPPGRRHDNLPQDARARRESPTAARAERSAPARSDRAAVVSTRRSSVVTLHLVAGSFGARLPAQHERVSRKRFIGLHERLDDIAARIAERVCGCWLNRTSPTPTVNTSRAARPIQAGTQDRGGPLQPRAAGPPVGPA